MVRFDVLGVGKKFSPLHKNNAVNLKINKIMTTQRLYSFLVVFLLMFFGTCFGQSPAGHFSAPKASDTAEYNKFISSEFANFFNKPSISFQAISTPKIISIKMVSASFYTSQLGFICKKELQMDKLTPIPFRFRLGSLAYVNYLEQKLTR